MSVFISYNHRDSEFVDKLAMSLISHNVKVWKDEWQISVGDSFINKIQDGLEGASYICVVFSNNSIKSEWVKREINAGLLKEIEDKKITILPVVIDDCKIPLLLRDKLFADFRDNFDTGLKNLLAVIKKKYNIDNSGRITDGLDYYIDYLIEQGTLNNKFFMSIDVISFDREEDFSVLTKMEFHGNEFVTKEYFKLTNEQDLYNYVIKTCSEEFEKNPARVNITGSKGAQSIFAIFDAQKKAVIKVKIKVNKLGIDTGNTVLFNVGALFTQICVNRGIIENA